MPENNPPLTPEDAPRPWGVTLVVRAPLGLKGRAVRCSRKRNMKLTPWLIEAIEEKVAREESAPAEGE